MIKLYVMSLGILEIGLDISIELRPVEGCH